MLFNPLIFNSAVFNVGLEEEEARWGSGWRRRQKQKEQEEREAIIRDDEEIMQIVAVLMGEIDGVLI